tara:strand:- start:221 stop:406 length:186 start_codon:yes stop_codon:yes gene_type:complete
LTLPDIRGYKAIMDEEFAYIECGTCTNYFFIVEMEDGINDPKYCPYCGCEFDDVYEVVYDG